MSLFEEHKAERRTRIQAAARKLVGTHGYEGLTMRELARAARVSVPTLYNLFGSKDAILMAELASAAPRIAAHVHTGDSFFSRGQAALEAGLKLIEESPAFYRAVIQMAITSPEIAPMRRRAEEAFIAIMASNLTAAKAAGQLAAWADPWLVARHAFAQYMACFLAWGIGELEWKLFRAAALSGIAHVMVGAARGPFAQDLERFLIEVQSELAVLHPTAEVPHGRSRSR